MFAILFIVTLVLIIRLLFQKRYDYWKDRNIPFCKPAFFVGNMGPALTLSTALSNIYEKLYNDSGDYRYYGFFNMWKPAILVRDPEVIKNILVKDFHLYRNWIEVEDEVDPAISLNPFVLHGDKWKSVRSVLTSQFTSSKIKPIVSNICSVNEKLIKYIKKETQISETLEVRQLATRFTGESVMINAFGLEGRSFEDKYPDSFKVGEEFYNTSKILLFEQTISLLIPNLRKILKVSFLGYPTTNTFKNIIKDTLKYRVNNNIVRKDYLGCLNEMKTKLVPYCLSDDDLVAHAFTFFIDGYETSSLCFAYALYEISQSYDIQNKAREEINAVLNKYNQVLSYEALQEMVYVECIFLETLRKYPIIKIITRVCLKDVIFPCPDAKNEDKDVVIKKGTEIIISCEGIHKDSKYFPNPKMFDPNRFNEQNKNSIPKYAYLGFGEGPKMCLGRTFALTQMKMALIAILLEFNLELNRKTEIPLKQENTHVFMSPKSEILVNFIPRI